MAFKKKDSKVKNEQGEEKSIQEASYSLFQIEVRDLLIMIWEELKTINQNLNEESSEEPVDETDQDPQ